MVAKKQKNFTALWYEKSLEDIASDLHDGIGHRLVAILWEIEDMKGRVGEENISGRLDELGEKLRETINDLQQIIYGARPALIDELGLLEALRIWIENQLRPKKILFKISTDGPEVNLTRFEADQVFRILQEGINNILQHASASAVHLQVAEDKANVVIRLTDNGRGFDYLPRTGTGLGLKTMHERAQMIRSELQIMPAESGGTLLKLLIPNKGEDAK